MTDLMTDLDRLLSSDLSSDPEARLVLADLLEEASRDVEALTMRAKARIQIHQRETLARLTAEHLATREACIAGLRAAMLEGVEDGPVRDVLAVAAATVTVGREDGYPAVSLPGNVRFLLQQATAAGIAIPSEKNYHRLGTTLWYLDFSGIINPPPIWEEDYRAWRQMCDYRRDNRL